MTAIPSFISKMEEAALRYAETHERNVAKAQEVDLSEHVAAATPDVPTERECDNMAKKNGSNGNGSNGSDEIQGLLLDALVENSAHIRAFMEGQEELPQRHYLTIRYRTVRETDDGRYISEKDRDILVYVMPERNDGLLRVKAWDSLREKIITFKVEEILTAKVSEEPVPPTRERKDGKVLRFPQESRTRFKDPVPVVNHPSTITGLKANGFDVVPFPGILQRQNA